jgi:hypothetical protein
MSVRLVRTVIEPEIAVLGLGVAAGAAVVLATGALDAGAAALGLELALHATSELLNRKLPRIAVSRFAMVSSDSMGQGHLPWRLLRPVVGPARGPVRAASVLTT